jgi:hypothetical protein
VTRRRWKRECNKTLKQRYPTEQAAQRVLLKVRIKHSLHDDTRRQEERVYRCEFCDGWHLTSKKGTSR